MTPLDFSKPVQTRDGRMVEIFSTTAAGDYPVVGQIAGETVIRTWRLDGRFNGSNPNMKVDLVQAPVKRSINIWLNVFSDGAVSGWTTREAAHRYNRSPTGAPLFACVNIQRDVTEAEGLGTEVTSVGETRHIDIESLEERL